jgi:uncharacterized membrane protein YhhN
MKARIKKHFGLGLFAFVTATVLALLALDVIGGYRGPLMYVTLVAGVVAFFVVIKEADKPERKHE